MPPGGPAVSTTAIRGIASRFFQVWNGDLSVIDELADRDLTVSYPLLHKVVHGPEAYKEVLTRIHSRFREFAFVPKPPIVDEDRAVIEWHGMCLHTANLLGVPPTGRQIRWTGISIYRIRAGKVVEERGEEDVLSILRQLGVGVGDPIAVGDAPRRS
jgi:predicted ester cyclase